MEGAVLMVYVPGMLPIVSNKLGKAHLRAVCPRPLLWEKWLTQLGWVLGI